LPVASRHASVSRTTAQLLLPPTSPPSTPRLLSSTTCSP
jgi:hypothetical protein